MKRLTLMALAFATTALLANTPASAVTTHSDIGSTAPQARVTHVAMA